jgi:hypothetical protein
VLIEQKQHRRITVRAQGMLKDLLAAALVIAGVLGIAWMIMRFVN